MNSPENPFKSDCAQWAGYKPCLVQKQTGQQDCAGCPEYWPEPATREVYTESYDPSDLVTAEAIGIVEMGGLGSVMRTTAVSHAIRAQNPHTDIHWFTNRRGAALLEYVPGVEAVNVEDAPFDTYKNTVDDLDVLLNFELSAAAQRIVANSHKIGGFALNGQNKFYGVMPEAEYIQRLQIDDGFRAQNELTMQEILLKTVGLEKTEPVYDVHTGPQNTIEARRVLSEAFDEEPRQGYIGINIGTSEKGLLRRWPAESHAELAERLGRKYPGFNIALLNGPDDDDARTRIMTRLQADSANVKILPNDMEVGDFIALVGQLDLLVTSDTFGFHAAKSQKIPVIALAGPMPSKELEITESDSIIGPRLSCSPCYHDCGMPTPGQCMLDIKVDDVFGAVVGSIQTGK